jgi:hypothetical protein
LSCGAPLLASPRLRGEVTGPAREARGAVGSAPSPETGGGSGRGLCVLLLALAPLACASQPNTHMNVLGTRPDAAHPGNFLGIPLRDGQLLLTESPEATSFVFAMIPKRFHYFTHGGIIAIENDEPVVYEVSGEVITLPLHSRVLDNVSGEVHRRPLLQYASSNLYVEVMDVPDGVDGAKVAAYARDAYKRHVPFDAYFRWDEHEKLFCTELVELSEEAGGAKPKQFVPVNDNPSLSIAIKWIGVPPDQALPAGLYYDPDRWVGALGQFATRTAAYAYFEAKHELHRRFQRNQRLGFLFALSGYGNVSVRPEITRFAFDASHLFDGETNPPEPGDPRIAREVRRFADATFGPAPDVP